MDEGAHNHSWGGLPEQQHDAFDADALEAAIRRERNEEFAALASLEDDLANVA